MNLLSIGKLNKVIQSIVDYIAILLNARYHDSLRNCRQTRERKFAWYLSTNYSNINNRCTESILLQLRK